IKTLLILGIILGILTVGAFFGVNNYLMPSIVEANELMLPDVVGLNKEEAFRKLEALKLTPIEVGPSYDARYEIDEVIFQKPYAGTSVKENRRVYIHVSGGEPIIKMPQLVGKTLRNARLNLERIGLFVRKVENIRSELPRGTIAEQEFSIEDKLEKGDSVNLKISVGPKLGMVRVPSLIAKSEKEAVIILNRLSLRLGEKTYRSSPSLLPNTIIMHTPAQNVLLSIGDSVNVIISKRDR
ncbi:MAG: PASTA domain-containing protein, partial [Melioribacteraceae bacterium]|nr:PASTA domain-containing protein [Melioribacteraceae bacterium]